MAFPPQKKDPNALALEMIAAPDGDVEPDPSDPNEAAEGETPESESPDAILDRLEQELMQLRASLSA